MVVSKADQLAVIASRGLSSGLAAPAMAGAFTKVVTAAPSWTTEPQDHWAPVASARMDVYVVLALRDPGAGIPCRVGLRADRPATAVFVTRRAVAPTFRTDV